MTEERKFGRWTEDFIRGAIERDREAAGNASKAWHQSHGCVIDADGTILSWVGGQSNLYRDGGMRDPIKETGNARFMVHARVAMEVRCQMIEVLLDRIAELEKAAQS